MPLSGQVHIDRALANVSVAYKNNRLVADALVPAVGVTRDSDRYYVYSKDYFRLAQTQRANKSESTKIDYGVSTSTYQLEDQALHGYVSQRDRDNSDQPLAPDVDLTEALTNMIQIRREWDLANLMTTTNWANSASLSAGLNWATNTDTTNPIVVIDSVTSVIANSGVLPNRMVISDKLYRDARNHVSIVDRTKYTSKDSVTPDILATLFGVQTLMVAGGIYNASPSQGLADSITTIWPSVTCFLAYMEPNPGLRKVSAMYRFEKRAGGNPWTVKKWPEPKLGDNVEAIEVSTMYQFKPVATDCAYLLNINA